MSELEDYFDQFGSVKSFLGDNSKKSRLIDIVLKNYSVIDKDVAVELVDGAQLFEGRWMMPTWGCDTLQKLIDEIEEME
jgi:hypothetical protein